MVAFRIAQFMSGCLLFEYAAKILFATVIGFASDIPLHELWVVVAWMSIYMLVCVLCIGVALKPTAFSTEILVGGTLLGALVAFWHFYQMNCEVSALRADTFQFLICAFSFLPLIGAFAAVLLAIAVYLRLVQMRFGAPSPK